MLMDGFVLFLGDWIPGCGCGNVDSGRGSAGSAILLWIIVGTIPWVFNCMRCEYVDLLSQ